MLYSLFSKAFKEIAESYPVSDRREIKKQAYASFKERMTSRFSEKQINQWFKKYDGGKAKTKTQRIFRREFFKSVREVKIEVKQSKQVKEFFTESKPVEQVPTESTKPSLSDSDRAFLEAFVQNQVSDFPPNFIEFLYSLIKEDLWSSFSSIFKAIVEYVAREKGIDISAEDISRVQVRGYNRMFKTFQGMSDRVTVASSLKKAVASVLESNGYEPAIYLDVFEDAANNRFAFEYLYGRNDEYREDKEREGDFDIFNNANF
jgi:hypothetical protein